MAANSFFKKYVYQKPKGIKKYVAASKIGKHLILANQEEQFITLWMLEDFSQRKGSHIHFCVVKVALTYLRRKGQPVVTYFSLLDTRYKEY